MTRLFTFFIFSSTEHLSCPPNLTQAVAHDDAKPGAAIAVQSFGDVQNLKPHLHVLVTDGCFYNDAAFKVCSPPDTVQLEKLFRYKFLKC